MRANTKGGSVLTADAADDGNFTWADQESSLGTPLCLCSKAGKAQGTTVNVGDAMWLLSADMTSVLVFVETEGGSLKLMAVSQSPTVPDNI